ncbi:MAG TPA: ABC transporter ATP-binding protein [Candidatus Poseidoniaceae archaeon]|nr:ABC transporter ATP-binding protein [Candidatus Poseidoniaceae archaeon]
MEEVVLQLKDATYRHSVYAPLPFKPWRRIRGQGIFSANLSLHKGTILGLVGPNGAGKTTLLRMLAGILPLQAGSVHDADEHSGTVISDERLRHMVGHMPEQVRWQGRNTVRNALLGIGEMRQVSESRIDGLLKLVGLQSRIDSPLNELSQGMRQRLTLAAALLGSPKILLLDEPLNGLDPVAAAAFIVLLGKLTEKGVSIVLSSHQVEGLVEIIDRLALMHRGQILAEGTMIEVAKHLNLDKKTEITGEGDAPDFSKYTVEYKSIEIEQYSNNWKAVLPNSGPGLLKKLVNDEFEIISWKDRQPNVIEMLCAATGQSVEDVGLEVSSTAVLPLRTFRGEEE